MKTGRRLIGRGLVLREVAVSAVVIVVSLSLLFVAMGETRRQGGLTQDENNLRWIGSMSDSYALAHDDRVPSFHGNLSDAAMRAIHIIRVQTGRSDLPLQLNWLPHIYYSYLELAYWLDVDLPDERFISTGDENLLLWASDPENWDQLGIPSPRSASTPYRSSYQMPPAFWSYPWSGPSSIRNATQAHDLYQVPSSVFMGPRSRSDVRFPSHKVFLHATHAWHFPVLSGDGVTTVRPYFAYEEARLPLLFADGSVRIATTSETNPGWNPGTPVAVPLARYDPNAWEPPTVSGAPTDLVTLHYRYTRDGLHGLDITPGITERVDTRSRPGRRQGRR